MIYEYPEEFIIPIVYAKDLKEKSIYRDTKPKYLHGGKLLIPDGELSENETFIADIDIYGDFQDKDINFLNIEGEVFKKSFQEPMIKKNIVGDNLENEYIKYILSDIDDDYANSETLSR